jgi:hypothetical protein
MDLMLLLTCFHLVLIQSGLRGHKLMKSRQISLLEISLLRTRYALNRNIYRAIVYRELICFFRPLH